MKKLILLSTLIFIASNGWVEDLDVQVEMRDGINLLTDIYIPAGDGPFPVILSRVPYGTKSDYILQPAYGEYFTDRGYVYVSQNVRGRFGSEGEFTAYIDGQEIPDAYDTIDWIFPKKSSSIMKIRLTINSLKNQITILELYDKNGGAYTYNIKDFKTNLEIAPFTFDTTKYIYVEVIDLR